MTAEQCARELYEVLENLLIHLGMGWEVDEPLEAARVALEKVKLYINT